MNNLFPSLPSLSVYVPTGGSVRVEVIDVRHALLSSGSNFVSEKDDGMSGMATSKHGKLSEEEVMKYQATLARSIVIFMEFLHLLIARNRDILLAAVQEHKRRSRYSQNSNNVMNKMSSNASYFSNPASPDNGPRMSRATSRSARSGSSSSIAGQSIVIMSDAFSTVEQQDAGGGVGDAGSVVSAMGSVSKALGGGRQMRQLPFSESFNEPLFHLPSSCNH
jgi:hypothetical protein